MMGTVLAFMQRQTQPATMRPDTHIQTGIDNAAASVWTEIISAISLVLPPNSLASAKLDVAVGAAPTAAMTARDSGSRPSCSPTITRQKGNSRIFATTARMRGTASP